MDQDWGYSYDDYDGYNNQLPAIEDKKADDEIMELEAHGYGGSAAGH